MRTETKSRRRSANPVRYVERVNLAIDHVVKHLGEPERVRLTDVARAAMLSPFHFHRVFQAIVGETVADFVKRLRLEKALVMMAHQPASRSRRMSLTAIAMACGFASSSDFSRSFKQRFGAAPSVFDIGEWRESHAAELQSLVDRSSERLHVQRPGGGRPKSAAGNPDGFRVRIRDLPARTVAYIRVHNPYAGGGVMDAVQRLTEWAERHGVAGEQWLGYQWDNPEIVPLEHCKYHVAVDVSRMPAFVSRGEIGRYRFPPMVVAQVEVRGGIDLELRALQWLYGTWLPRSGYVPDDHPAFEARIGRPFEHGVERFELDVQLPVKRM